MPPKSKKQELYERRALAARQAKISATNHGEIASSAAVGEATVTSEQDLSDGRPRSAAEVQDTSVRAPFLDSDQGRAPLLDSDQSDSSYDPDDDCGDSLEMFVEDWARSLGREDTISLGFVSYL